jgi:hypothetical protein
LADLTEKERELLKKQAALGKKKKVQAHLDGALLPHEENDDDELEQEVAAELKARRSRAKERRAKKLRRRAITQARMVDLSGKACYLVDTALDSPELRGLLQQKGATVAATRAEAKVFITTTPANMEKAKDVWTAILTGAFVVTPRACKDGGGPVVKYKAARLTPRVLYATAKFQEKHPAIIQAIRTLTKWKFLATKEEPQLRLVAA